ncbi:DUF2867 domain-containing protein [Pseudomonas sp. Fl5BN2]|uniref:DUF2867 domain-containing protein n=1 Tax=unclassified Pseudomonas TaxID=196821 RepID=UPI0013775A58|nr:MULTISPECIES: DUF2867 domain-containing protein [unclassified Pseudomonas]NBF06301.1 DUF2867 domain-containing protein [Pseudomonas sp. Fl5BN2]NBF12591.1 DUF2867 domain-containing protein [Pseudomonas sp. Fl4BN1]
MPASVTACSLLASSSIAAFAPGATFIDCRHTLANDPERTAMRHLLILMSQTPAWIERMMGLRNRVVQLFGLKDLGHLRHIDLARADEDYQAGDRVGIFTLISQSPDEVLVVDRDKHLDVYLSLNRLPLTAEGQRPVVLSTLVHPHNLLGRLYMLPVAPFHRIIAPMTLANINAH